MIGWVVGPELLLFPFTVRDVVGLKRNKKQEIGNKKTKKVSQYQ